MSTKRLTGLYAAISTKGKVVHVGSNMFEAVRMAKGHPGIVYIYKFTNPEKIKVVGEPMLRGHAARMYRKKVTSSSA